MSIEQFYQLVVALIPDSLMVGLMAAAAVTSYLRYRRRRNWAIWGLIIALCAFTLFYIWGVLFAPPSLARLAAGRAVSFGISVAIIIWNASVLLGKDD